MRSADICTKAQLLQENKQLRARLDEAEQTLQAIRSGEVDALVVEGPQGDRVFSLAGADHIYRVIAETMHEAVLTVDPQGTILFCNRRFADLMKTPMNAALGRKVTSFVSRPQEQPLERLLAAVQKGPVQRRLTLRASDGTSVPVQLSAVTIDEDSSTSICLLATDLTAIEASAKSIRILREHQQALEESEHRFRAIFESSRDAIVIANEEGTCVQANPAVRVIFGLSEQIVGRPIWEFIPNSFDDPSAWQKFLTSGLFYRETLFTGKDGRVRHLDCSAVANILQDRHLFVLRDITEHKGYEENLRKAHQELQTYARSLEAANAELDSFSHSVSHDLRSPLRAIVGFARMILDEKEATFDPETRRKFNIIQENAEKMGRLIDDLLRLARLGRAELNLSTVDMGRLVEEVIKEIRTAEPAREFASDIGELPKVLGDPVMIRQLLVNLLSNAVKFTRGKQGARIEVGSFERSGEQVFYVKDNGIGFDMNYIDKLFGVFQRLVSESRFEGTGVGLSIVKRVAQRHGGRVWAEGKIDEGASFFFILSPRRADNPRTSSNS